MAQHITFNKAIKNSKDKQFILKFFIFISTVFMALLKVICWTIIFITRIRFPPGKLWPRYTNVILFLFIMPVNINQSLIQFK